MPNHPDNAPVNILEQIRKLSREFGKEISQGKSPRIRKYLSQIPEDGREDLFTNLIATEINFLRSKGESPTSDEYLKRFPRFKKQVRRAFFEPTVDSSDSTDGDDQTASLRSPGQDADAFAPTCELPNATRLGEYELIRELGRGGMGIVYEARHRKTNNRIALKTLPTGGDSQQVNADKLYRFRKEFRRLSEINHSNLVGMQSLEVDGNRWFFTMDLVNGEDFLSYVRPDDRLDEERLRSCLKQLATGIMELHRRGIVHRDLKPSNVLVSIEGHVTILDFGLAAELQRAGDMTQTKSGMFSGTPPYAAPEQMFGERTEASDWYAFGTMLFEVLAGERPFRDRDPMALLRQKQEQDPPQLADRDEFPSDLSALTDGLLRREPGMRLTAVSVGERLGLHQETRTTGSTRESNGSTGSGDTDATELGEFEDEEIVLIGREEQMAQLEAINQEFLETRKPQVVWISGLSGEGKSLLAEKFLRPIRQGKEMLVLSGRCYDGESIPYKVIDSQIDALVSFLRSLPNNEAESYLPSDIEMLAHLFPLLRRVKSIQRRCEKTMSVSDERQVRNLAFAAFRDLLTVIGKDRPIVMFIDDLQWGDADSASVMANLIFPVSPPALMLLGSYRSDEVEDSPFLENWRSQIEAHSDTVPARSITVEPLTRAECLAFIRERFEESNPNVEQHFDQLFNGSNGNPYFLEQLIEGYDAATGAFQPISFANIIDRRLDRCSDDARGLLQIVAASGKAVGIDEIARVAERDTVVSTLTHMSSERLVRLIGSVGDRLVDTYHDKVRETTLGQLSTSEIKALHLKYAEVLETDLQRRKKDTNETPGGGSERIFDLAHHFTRADDPRAFHYQLCAGEAALEACAMENALDHLRKAEQLKPNLDQSTTYRLNSLMARALAGCAMWSEAIERFEVSLAHSNIGYDRAKCFFALGDIFWRLSEYAEAEKNLRLGFRVLGERLPRTLLGKLIAGVASITAFYLLPSWMAFRIRRRNKDEAAFLAQMFARCSFMATQRDVYLFAYLIARGSLIAKHAGDSTDKRLAQSNYASVLAFTGGRVLVSRLMSNATRLADTDATDLSSGLYHYYCGVFNYSSGRLDEAQRSFDIAAIRLGRTGDYAERFVYHFLWHTWAIRGNSNQILVNCIREEEIATKSNDQMFQAYSWYGQVEALANQGNFFEALGLADRAIDKLKPLGSMFLCIAHLQKARAQLQSDDFNGARKSAWQTIKSMPKMRFFEITSPAFAVFAEAVISSEWANGARRATLSDRFKTATSASAARIAGLLFPTQRAHAYRVSGRAKAAIGKSKKALKYFDKAITVADGVGVELQKARALIDKSVLDYQHATNDRKRGIHLLETLGCVLPDAEVGYLGIDREAHHARAAAARANEQA